MSNVCGWVVDKCGCGGCWSKHNDATKERAAALATHFMWAATGRRYGVCQVVVMPCTRRPVEPLYVTYPVGRGAAYGDDTGPYGPIRIAGGQIYNQGCGDCCSAPCELQLDGPVQSIVDVLVDGVPVDPSAYQVHNRSLLVRIDGHCWPTCQRFDTQIPGFEVVYMRGTPVPSAVQAALEMVACEYATACAVGGEACRLPANIASLTRQGVEVTVAEVDATRAKLRTGITAVDDVLDADNPYGLIQPPQVFSPDLPPSGRVITWAGGS